MHTVFYSPFSFFASLLSAVIFLLPICIYSSFFHINSVWIFFFIWLFALINWWWSKQKKMRIWKLFSIFPQNEWFDSSIIFLSQFSSKHSIAFTFFPFNYLEYSCSKACNVRKPKKKEKKKIRIPQIFANRVYLLNLINDLIQISFMGKACVSFSELPWAGALINFKLTRHLLLV